MKLLKAEYKRRSQLRPLLWDNTIELPLENVYTRLKIVSRRKLAIQIKDDRVNAFGIFKAPFKGSDNTIELPLESVYTRLKIVSRRKLAIQMKDDKVNAFSIFKAPFKGSDVMTLTSGSSDMHVGKSEPNVFDVVTVPDKAEDVPTPAEKGNAHREKMTR